MAGRRPPVGAGGPPRRRGHVLTPFPQYRTALFGRNRELAGLTEALGASRLVTLVGPGGVGKTRLVSHWAADAAAVCLCRLEAARNASDISAVVARTLSVPLGRRPTADPVGEVAIELRGRAPVTVILDNVEQLIEPLRAILPRWLAVPGVRVVATSRWPLRLGDEVIVPVDALPAAAGEALFRAAAPAPLPGDPPTDATIAAIVEHLDGNPLAIELAAARTEVLELAQIHARLGERFALLRDPERPDHRHGALWNTIDWSWTLLQPWCREGLCQLAVFADGFEVEAAEAIVRLPEGRPALDALHMLWRRALLRREGARFALPETVLAYATARLAESPEAEAVLSRHARWYLERAQRWAEAVDTRAGEEALEALVRAFSNVEAVHRRALATSPPTRGSAQQALAAVLGLEPLLLTRLTASEAVDLLGRTVDHAAAAGLAETTAFAAALRLRGRAWRFHGDNAAALADFEAALALVGDDRRLEARVHNAMAEVLTLEHRLEESKAHSMTALRFHEAAGDPRWEGISRAQIGLTLSYQGALAEARDHWLIARRQLAATGDRIYQAIIIGHLASFHLEAGELDLAQAHAEEAIALHSACGNRRSAAICRGYIAMCHHQRGELAVAEAVYTECLLALEAVGEARFAAYQRYYRALIHLERDDREAAAADLADAARALEAVSARRYQALVQVARAALGVRQGTAVDLQPVRAELAAIADPLLTPVGALPAAAAALPDDLPTARRHARELAEVAGDDARLAGRIVRAWIALAEEEARAWRFCQDGTWFEPHGGARVELGHRAPLARLLARLVRARASAEPSVARHALIEAGWPGERLLPRAAGNRLRVALSTLRKMGLAEVLRRTAAGYQLDPAVPIRWQPPKAPTSVLTCADGISNVIPR